MDNNVVSLQKQMFSIIKELTGQSNILTMPRIFVELLEDHEQALFLSQLIYWSDKGKLPGGWFYKTYDEWHEETLLTEYKIRKAKKRLEKLGIIETKIKKANGNPTVHYKLNANALVSWFLKKLQERNLKSFSNDTLKTLDSLTKITPKISSKNTGEHKGVSPDGVTLAVTFPQYLDRFGVDNEEMTEAIHYYLEQYEQYRGKPHPRLKPEQWERVLLSLISANGEFDNYIELMPEDLIPMIDKHFETRYEDCDYNILHFISEGVKKNRFYEVAY